MNEAQTRLNKIDPKLRDAGWSIVPGSKILVEARLPRLPRRVSPFVLCYAPQTFSYFFSK